MEKADLLAKRNMEEKRLRVKELQVDHLVERMQNYQQVKDSEEAKLRQLKEKVQEEDMKYKRYKNAKEREMQDVSFMNIFVSISLHKIIIGCGWLSIYVRHVFYTLNTVFCFIWEAPSQRGNTHTSV